MPGTSLAVNNGEFHGKNATKSLLCARGFHPATGARSGGISDPKLVFLPPGTILFRFYHDPKVRFGAWWCTPHELSLVIDYFTLQRPEYYVGRTKGKGILHGILAVRHDWAGEIPEHLGLFTIIRLVNGLDAFYGEGDVAPNEAQDQAQKPLKIMVGGRQRAVRQVFLPELWNYQNQFTELRSGLSSDQDLIRSVESFVKAALPFEL